MNEMTKTDTVGNPDLANIVGSKTIAQPSVKSLTFNDPLKGQRTIVPVSDEIARFIKDEFSKIKSNI